MGTDENNASDQARQLMAMLTHYLRARARGISADHDDLVQQTLADFYRIRPENLPLSQAQSLALTILRRRIADHYRELSRNTVARHVADDNGDEEALYSEAPELLARWRLLRRVLGIIADLPERDRSLLMSRTGPLMGRAMTPAERKRLSRIRARMRAVLAGEDADALPATDPFEE